MSLHACILLLVLPCVPGEETMDSAVRRRLDDTLPGLQALTRTSPELRRKLAGKLPAESATFLYRIKEKRYEDDTLRSLTDLVYHAVRASGRYAKVIPAPKPTVAILEKTRIVAVTFAYPAVALSDKEAKADLVLTVWVCPDRSTALHLAWLRQRGGVPDKQSAVEDLQAGALAAARLLAGEKQPGELIYKYDPYETLNEALKKGDPRISHGRLGMLRANLLVEAETHSYGRPEPKENWFSTGVSPRDTQELTVLFATLENGLKAIQPGKAGQKP